MDSVGIAQGDLFFPTGQVLGEGLADPASSLAQVALEGHRGLPSSWCPFRVPECLVGSVPISRRQQLLLPTPGMWLSCWRPTSPISSPPRATLGRKGKKGSLEKLADG